MNILYLSNLFPNPRYPGDGNFVYQRFRRLYRRPGIDAFPVLLNPMIKKVFRLLFQRNYNLNSLGLEEPVPVEVLNFLRIPRTDRYVRVVGQVRRLFHRYRCRLLHLHFASEGMIAYLLKKKYDIPYVLTAHGTDIHTDPWRSPRVRARTVKVLEAADRVIFVSDFLRRTALQFGYSGHNGLVIPNGIDPERFFPGGKRQIYGDPDTRVVGFVGTLTAVKNAHRLPLIFSEIARLLPGARFLVVGEGVLRAGIEAELVRRELWNRTLLTGQVGFNDVPRYLNEMDVLVLPSRSEGWPCVVLEAFACGVPVVGRRAGGIPEAIADGGLVVDPGEDFEKRFARAVYRLLQQPLDRASLVKRAAAFSWEHIVEREIAVYRQVGETPAPLNEDS